MRFLHDPPRLLLFRTARFLSWEGLSYLCAVALGPSVVVYVIAVVTTVSLSLFAGCTLIGVNPIGLLQSLTGTDGGQALASLVADWGWMREVDNGTRMFGVTYTERETLSVTDETFTLIYERLSGLYGNQAFIIGLFVEGGRLVLKRVGVQLEEDHGKEPLREATTRRIKWIAGWTLRIGGVFLVAWMLLAVADFSLGLMSGLIMGGVMLGMGLLIVVGMSLPSFIGYHLADRARAKVDAFFERKMDRMKAIS